MTTDYRAMCANLTAALNDWQCETGDDRYEGLLDRARALLAEPVAEGPTDDEIHDFIALWWEDFGKGYLPCSSDKPLVKAALARFGGRPAAAPVPDPGKVS